ncbi:MAG: acyl-CoA thioesterase [Propionibacteriaceae bacterium]|jgi:acyl-CoA thioester hydrolase|nr:acyl-CoA thioesterase [Propionibacteriaceae bacterium]
MIFRTTVPLRWGDLDAQGHINNAAYADYLQEARADYFDNTPIESLSGSGLVVVSHQVEYLAPAYFRAEPLIVDLWPCQVSAAKFTLAYDLWQDGRQVARARTVLCPYDLVGGQPRRFQAHERAWLTSQVEAAEAFRPLRWRPMNSHARSAPMRVRWGDVDCYGHVNNVLYFNYIMEGRIAFTAAASHSMNETLESGYLWFVVRQDVNYLTPLFFRIEPYTIRTGVAKIGSTSITFCSEIADPTAHKRFATASTVAVFADAEGRPTEILPQWREALQPYRLTAH